MIGYVSDARYPIFPHDLLCRCSTWGAYRSYGGVEVDLETMISSEEMLSLCRIIWRYPLVGSQVSLRGGYQYNFSKRNKSRDLALDWMMVKFSLIMTLVLSSENN